MASPTPLPFTYDESLASYAATLPDWHSTHVNRYGGLVAAALVFDPRNRVLLLRRADHDFLPGQWEPPGGSVDPAGDASILHACARELREEAGLTVDHIHCLVGDGNDFFIRETLYRRITFLVTVKEDDTQVRTDQEEHSVWRWASEDEVLAERTVEGDEMPLTFEDVKKSLVEGFRIQEGNRTAQG